MGKKTGENKWLKVEKHPVKGRGYIAARDIPQGTRVLSESTVGHVMLPSVFLSQDGEQANFCASCCLVYPNSLNSGTTLDCCKTNGTEKDRVFGEIWLCSALCQALFLKTHGVLCSKTTKDFPKLSPELMLAVVLLVSNDASSLESLEVDEKVAENLIQKDVETLEALIPHLLQSEAIDYEETELRKNLLKNLKLCYANSFGMRLTLLDTSPYALGIFAKASLFNHSCAPNCHYYFKGNTIQIFATEEIPRGTECLVSFISNMEGQTREARKNAILKNLGFDCACERCTTDTYIEVDDLLEPSLCLSNDTKHENLWNFASKLLEEGQEEKAWKFYQRMFQKFEHHYRPFDPMSFVVLDRIVTLAFNNFDDKTGRQATKLGLEFAARLTNNGVVNNCYLLELRFAFFHLLFNINKVYAVSTDEVLADLTREARNVQVMVDLLFKESSRFVFVGETTKLSKRIDNVVKFVKDTK